MHRHKQKEERPHNMELEFLGVRGSMPVSGDDRNKYGGHTLCACIVTSDGEWIIIDAGTGISKLGDIFASQEEKKPLNYHLLLTHFHLDHITGLPFFAPLYSSKTTLTGVVVDMRFLYPITLSGTESALSYIPGKTTHGRMPDKSFYHIRHSELDIVGHSDMDFRVELNTQGKSPGTYKVIVTVYSTQQDYKYMKSELTLIMK